MMTSIMLQSSLMRRFSYTLPRSKHMEKPNRVPGLDLWRDLKLFPCTVLPFLRAVGETRAQRCAAIAPKEVCEAITLAQLEAHVKLHVWGHGRRKRVTEKWSN